mmetsp:Transcript_155853/g.290889  ORF Transcript_155853/g.290889 Transcript_155853/m.290889 type:complete len:211 (-) Transcript_155853:116-748(-)
MCDPWKVQTIGLLHACAKRSSKLGQSLPEGVPLFLSRAWPGRPLRPRCCSSDCPPAASSRERRRRRSGARCSSSSKRHKKKSRRCNLRRLHCRSSWHPRGPECKAVQNRSLAMVQKCRTWPSQAARARRQSEQPILPEQARWMAIACRWTRTKRGKEEKIRPRAGRCCAPCPLGRAQHHLRHRNLIRGSCPPSVVGVHSKLPRIRAQCRC